MSQSAPRSASARRKVLKQYLIWCVVGYAGVVTIFAGLQRKLIYLPTTADRITPSDAGELAAVVQHVTVEAEDGLTLNGWFVPARGDSRATVIYFPGNAANRINRVGFLSLLREAGADCYLFDYRGYGENSGFPSEEGIAGDVRRVWDFVVDQRGAGPEQIVLYGQSLGGGVAVRLAQEKCQDGTPPGGLITVAAFSSAVDVGRRQFPWLPVGMLMVDRFPSVERIGDVTCPVLHVHGVEDNLVPMSLGKKLHAAAPEQSAGGIAKRFVEIPGAGHNDILYAGQPAFGNAIREFINTVIAD